MSGAQLELADPSSFSSVEEYIEKHLAPVVSELHRLTNEMMTPGSTAEAGLVDMTTCSPEYGSFERCDRPLKPEAKHVVFDGTEYFTLPKELLKAKQVKVQLTAVVYATGGPGTVEFQLFDEKNKPIQGSSIQTSERDPATFTRRLPFGDAPHSIRPSTERYYLQARAVDRDSIPVCRRFSLSFIYL